MTPQQLSLRESFNQKAKTEKSSNARILPLQADLTSLPLRAASEMEPEPRATSSSLVLHPPQGTERRETTDMINIASKMADRAQWKGFERWASGVASTAIGSWGARRGGWIGLLALTGAGFLAWRAGTGQSLLPGMMASSSADKDAPALPAPKRTARGAKPRTATAKARSPKTDVKKEPAAAKPRAKASSAKSAAGKSSQTKAAQAKPAAAKSSPAKPSTRKARPKANGAHVPKSATQPAAEKAPTAMHS